MPDEKERAKKVMPISPGRPKGVPNKTTALLKDAILKAAEEAGGGGEEGLVKYLKARAVDTPGPFLALLGKVMPTQISGENGGPLQVVIKKFTLNG